MREKIAKQPIKVHRYDGKTYLTLDGIDELITLACEEIEKVENPYPCNEDWIVSRGGFEDCRQKILALLR